MDHRTLQYFVNVVEAGSFSAAAAVLDLAQPTLSRQIALLEADVGQRLLVRTGRGVVPTEAGEALLMHARAMLDIAQRAREELRELHSSPAGRIAIGLPPRVGLGLSARLVQRFRERLPRAVISVSEGLSPHLREWLIAGRLDLALLFDPPASPQLGYETLMQESLVLVAPRHGARLPARISLAGLAKYPMVLPGAPNSIRGMVDAALRPRRIELQVVAEVGAVQTVLSLVAQGMGCTILPEGALALGEPGLALQHARIGPPTIRTSLVLAVPRAGPSTRLMRETVDLLKSMDFGALGRHPQ
ncbi:LysR substrate-binding domain-containing protein [Polaromonas sp.]|uniref:LysR substrate-binding domain-containing protein n=1 Tax=Polaromonas sp. TaxID=1869339 RepID=UPI0033578063